MHAEVRGEGGGGGEGLAKGNEGTGQSVNSDSFW
jgi:hypothetical protein